jgi:hypothetical protein
MKQTFIVLMLCLGAALCSGQELSQVTSFAYVLPDFRGEFQQWGFAIGASTESYSPTGQAKKFKSYCTKNCLQIETVAGVTELIMTDSHDFCSLGTGFCSYSGTFTSFNSQVVNKGNFSYTRISGELVGTFTDAQGNISNNVSALYSAETYPANNGILEVAPGNLTVILQLN